MPSERKQLPKNRKRVTASARVRISVRKSRKTVNNGLDGSYLHTEKETVSNLTSVTGPSTSHNSSEAIMAMLHEIKELNAALARRMDRVEDNNSTPINPCSHTLGQPPVSPHTSSLGAHRAAITQMGDPLLNDAIRQPYTQPNADAGVTFQPEPRASQPLQGQVTMSYQPQVQHMDSLPQPQGQLDHISECCDAVMPSLQVLRGNPGISESVNGLLASYEGRVHSQLTQGKQNSVKRSGRYNSHDSVTAAPHLRWPNEGYTMTCPYPSGLLGS